MSETEALVPIRTVDSSTPTVPARSSQRRRGRPADDFFASLLITGLLTGAIYALVALGFVLVYKATGIINFAQGEIVMFGAFFAAALLGEYGLPAIVAIPMTMVIMAGLGLVTERVVLRPMVGRPTSA